MYSETTNSVHVTVVPVFLEQQSDPSDNLYFWAYHIQIENLGPDMIQLKNRYWHITDAHGQSQEVRGPGVIGEQPFLRPGDVYRYTSGTPLPTPSGIMRGHYEMENAEGGLFEVKVPAFSLDSPHQPLSLN